jgi:hypothetical protein
VCGIAKPPAPVCLALRDASLRAWQALVQLAVAREAAFVVVAGGLFDPDGPSLRARVALRDGIETLHAHGVRVFIALGPPDAAAAPLESWVAAGATVFAEGEVSALSVGRDGRHLATVQGASCVRSDPARLLSEGFRRSGSSPTIGVLPLRLETAGAHAAAAQPTLREAGLSYCALGGAHGRATLWQEPLAMYCGTPQGRALEADELGAKGCLVVAVEDGSISDVSAVALGPVGFLSLAVDANGGGDVTATRQRLLDDLERATADQAERVFIAEACIEGHAADGSQRLAFDTALLAALRHACETRIPLVWWARVRNRTAHRPRAGEAAGGALRGALIGQMEALGASLPRSTFLAQHFAPLLRIWNAEIELGAERELLRDAALLALASLEAEDGR